MRRAIEGCGGRDVRLGGGAGIIRQHLREALVIIAKRET
jgi:hypothetical protein